MDAKKVGQGQSEFAERPKASVAAHSSNSLFPRPLREVIEGEPTSGSSKARKRAGSKSGDFFGDHPEKLLFAILLQKRSS